MNSTPTKIETRPAPTVATWLRADFALTILLSAFLLFQVQPLISKFILPWFGGSPAVWTTCMLFFQVVLFLGYAYAHLSSRLLSPRWQGTVHLALLVAAACTLPIAPDASWKPADASHPTLRILLLLTAHVGLPYFALSSTGPLVQTWFARAFPGRSPYRLYALSNAGSLLALLSYPILFEPRLDVVTHANGWSMVFALFVIPCGLGALWLRRTSTAVHADIPASEEPAQVGRPAWWQRALWLALPACATLMLLATTNHVCQEIAVIPFLWVVPLSLYLLTFIITFDHQRWYARRVFATATILLVLAVAGIHPLRDLLDRVHYDVGFLQQVVLYFGALFAICMVCHGELVRLRPAPRYLTEFYLLISAGGALGGLLVTVAFPALFTTFFEWKVGLALSFLLGAIVVAGEIGKKLPARPLVRALVSATVLVGVGVVGLLQWSDDEPLDIARSFYGVVYVTQADEGNPDDHYLAMVHGATVHGRQFVAPDKRMLPISYYSRKTGIGQALEYFHASGPVRVGAVGLGVGTLAAYSRPGDHYAFYELNADVWRMADKHFTYLRSSAGRTEVVLGDARLSLEREQPREFHVLALDAFTGDAPPAHLLTEEAFQVYLRHLRPDGVVAFHITNRRVDLMPVVEGLAKRFGFQVVRIGSDWDGDKLLFRSDWALLTRNAELIADMPSTPPAAGDESRPPVLWTDHYNNLYALLK
jgi:hypothetical protein